MIEINALHDDMARLVFTQAIYFDWCDRDCQHHVVDWRLVKSDSLRPRFDYVRRDWVARWDDNGTLREVRAKHYRETRTQYDPELVDRAFLPKEERRLLGRLK